MPRVGEVQIPDHAKEVELPGNIEVLSWVDDRGVVCLKVRRWLGEDRAAKAGLIIEVPIGELLPVREAQPYRIKTIG